MINFKKYEVTKKVQGFYNRIPFPNYSIDKFKNKTDLETCAQPFAEVLNRSIPKNSSIIDIGTGTGQLSAYLSLNRESVWGIDFSDNSLEKAELLKQNLKLNSLSLKKVDITNISEVESIGKKFDYLICFGVLHHTANPYQSFQNILTLLKPGGYIAIGLYNRYGRILLKVRVFLIKTIFKKNNRIKEQFINMQIDDTRDEERAKGWWNDQYNHPHESTHTVGEILEWFKKNDVDFMHTLPPTKFGQSPDIEIAGVWNNYNDGISPGIFSRIIGQLSWIWKTHREGGYWITFGRKK